MSRRHLFKDKEHLVRMAGIFAAGILLFLGAQLLFVPKTFGVYGHYRGAAIAEESRKPVSYAGRSACVSCHEPVGESQKNGKHAALGCEGCHGALVRHVTDAAHVRPAKVDSMKLCPKCHQANVARPKWLKQIDPDEHNSPEPCVTCHQPHSPQM